MGENIPNIGTIGPAGAQLVRGLLHLGKSIFTLDDAVQILNKGDKETSNILGTLVKKSIIARIKGGTYVILQIGSEEAQLSNWPIIAKAMISDTPYYLSYYSAMRLHGMTTHALYDVYITTSKRHRNHELNGIRYNVIYRKEKHFWGFETKWVTKQEKVIVSDIERTVLDAFERPELCGGITEIIRGMWSKQNQFDWDKLVEYANRFPTKAAVKRLGFVLETLNLADNYIDNLRAIAEESKTYNLLDPIGQNQGKHLKRWWLRLNTDISAITGGLWG